jgi:hypothetical protein
VEQSDCKMVRSSEGNLLKLNIKLLCNDLFIDTIFLTAFRKMTFTCYLDWFSWKQTVNTLELLLVLWRLNLTTIYSGKIFFAVQMQRYLKCILFLLDVSVFLFRNPTWLNMIFHACSSISKILILWLPIRNWETLLVSENSV